MRRSFLLSVRFSSSFSGGHNTARSVAEIIFVCICFNRALAERLPSSHNSTSCGENSSAAGKNEEIEPEESLAANVIFFEAGKPGFNSSVGDLR